MYFSLNNVLNNYHSDLSIERGIKLSLLQLTYYEIKQRLQELMNKKINEPNSMNLKYDLHNTHSKLLGSCQTTNI